jgi:hypothetical protein
MSPPSMRASIRYPSKWTCYVRLSCAGGCFAAVASCALMAVGRLAGLVMRCLAIAATEVSL